MMENSIGDRIRDIRGKKSLKAFCEPLGVTPTAISNVENGHTELSMHLALKISETYNVTLDYLVKGFEVGQVSEPKAEYNKSDKIEINKDELIELQRLALMNTQTKLKNLEQKQLHHEALKNS